MHGHLQPTIMMHNFSRLTVDGIREPGLCVVNVTQMQLIMQCLIVCFVTHTAIKPASIHSIVEEVDMLTTVRIVIRAIQEVPPIKENIY